MNVNFTVQVLSNTVANVSRSYYGEETHGTANGQFFDCLNVRNQIDGVKKQKLFLQPYTNLNDECFK